MNEILLREWATRWAGDIQADPTPSLVRTLAGDLDTILTHAGRDATTGHAVPMMIALLEVIGRQGGLLTVGQDVTGSWEAGVEWRPTEPNAVRVGVYTAHQPTLLGALLELFEDVELRPVLRGVLGVSRG